MGRLTEEPFVESCCDGGACLDDNSAQPCGCDKGAKPPHLCEWHRGIATQVSTRLNSTIEEWKEISAKVASNYEVRKFETGATRDQADTKFDYEGFLSPLVIDRFAAYMHKHRQQPDGQLRNSDNWQLGIPQDAYVKSGFRHFMDWWRQHRGYKGQDTLEDSLCALLFNVQGYLLEVLREKDKKNSSGIPSSL